MPTEIVHFLNMMSWEIPMESGEFVYGHDGLDRLIAVMQDNKEISRYEYEYDSYGNIICKNKAGNGTRYLYDSLDRLTEKYKIGGARMPPFIQINAKLGMDGKFPDVIDKYPR